MYNSILFDYCLRLFIKDKIIFHTITARVVMIIVKIWRCLITKDVIPDIRFFYFILKNDNFPLQNLQIEDWTLKRSTINIFIGFFFVLLDNNAFISPFNTPYISDRSPGGPKKKKEVNGRGRLPISTKPMHQMQHNLFEHLSSNNILGSIPFIPFQQIFYFNQKPKIH